MLFLNQRKKCAHAAKTSPFFEQLEGRTLLSVSGFPGDHGQLHHGERASTVVYVESNNPTAGQNAVLALRREADGSLRQFGSFLTGGTGEGNPSEGLGPDDSDKEVVASPDGRWLFAVNQGSNSIATFRIHHDGRLSLIGAFDSGGTQPVSLGLAGNRLYVTNRGDALTGQTATVAGNYTAFNISAGGKLTAVPNSTITLTLGLSPSQTLVSPDGRFVFGDNFAIPNNPNPSATLGNTIDPFQIATDGTLHAAPGGPVGASATAPFPTLLGLAAHPNQRIIYGSLVAGSEVAVFTYDSHGSVTFVRTVADNGAGPCWVTVSADGKHMYVANTGSNSIEVYSLSDPLNPKLVQDFKPNIPSSTAPVGTFEFALDPSGRYLEVITQATSQSNPQGNAVHTLAVAHDGTLSEPTAPVTFSTTDVPATARIQGVAVVSLDHDHGHHE